MNLSFTHSRRNAAPSVSGAGTHGLEPFQMTSRYSAFEAADWPRSSPAQPEDFPRRARVCSTSAAKDPFSQTLEVGQSPAVPGAPVQLGTGDRSPTPAPHTTEGAGKAASRDMGTPQRRARRPFQRATIIYNCSFSCQWKLFSPTRCLKWYSASNRLRYDDRVPNMPCAPGLHTLVTQ